MFGDSSKAPLTVSGSTLFYTHSTDLSTPGHSSLYMTSLRFPQLQLRLPIADDAASLQALFSDQRNIQYDKSCSGLDKIDAISNLIQQWRDIHHPLARANVVVVVNGKTIGTGGLGWIGTRRTDGALIGDAGMMLDAQFRGKGYAYEALCMVIDHGFRVLGMQEVHMSCVDANSAFKGLMNVKFGFRAEPIQDKVFGNEWIWRVTRDMWAACRHSAEGRQRVEDYVRGETGRGGFLEGGV